MVILKVNSDNIAMCSVFETSNLFNFFREIEEKRLRVWHRTVNTPNTTGTVLCTWQASFHCFSLSLTLNKKKAIMRTIEEKIRLQQCHSPSCSVEWSCCVFCALPRFTPLAVMNSHLNSTTWSWVCCGAGSRKWAMDFLPVSWKPLDTSEKSSILLSTAIKFLQTFNNIREIINIKIIVNNI